MKKNILTFILILFVISLISCGKEKIFELENPVVTLHLNETYTPTFIIQNIKKNKIEYSYNTDIIEIKDGVIFFMFLPIH